MFYITIQLGIKTETTTIYILASALVHVGLEKLLGVKPDVHLAQKATWLCHAVSNKLGIHPSIWVCLKIG